ncbi:hypothetical protein B4Q13_24540, partial [Lacticaseibacillus rhamnosus]
MAKLEKAVAGDGRPVAVAVRLTQPGDACGAPSPAVVDEYVLRPVGVSGHEIRRHRFEGDVAPVGGPGRISRGVVGLRAIGGDGHSRQVSRR